MLGMQEEGFAGASIRDGAPGRFSAIVAGAFDLRPGDLRGSTRGCARVALARQVAMYLARVSLGLTLSEAGRLFGRDRTTAAHACRQIEDRRDDKDFDMLLDRLERAVRRMSRADTLQ